MNRIIFKSHDEYMPKLVLIALTSWAITKAATSNKPGRSINDQLRDRVTNMRAWLIVLTCRYIADASFLISSVSFFWRLDTPNVLWKVHNKHKSTCQCLYPCLRFIWSFIDWKYMMIYHWFDYLFFYKKISSLPGKNLFYMLPKRK
jgi:hypothetical protein